MSVCLSAPSGAILSVYDMNAGKEIINATTPHTATLKRGAGYFRKAEYKVTVIKPGYSQKEMIIEGKVNGWYLGGNFLFGGLIGWFIVDPITGSMWTLQPESVDIKLSGKEILFAEPRRRVDNCSQQNRRYSAKYQGTFEACDF